MPRQGTTSRNQRVAVETQTSNQKLGVYAPSVVNARSDAAVTAAALSASLGLAGDVVQQEAVRRDREGFDQATQDFAQGIDPQSPNAGYERAYSQLTARRQWVEAKRQIEEELRQTNTDDMSAEELGAFLDSKYADFTGMDENEADVLVPRMLAFREDTIQQWHERQKEIVLNDQAASLTVVVEDGYENYVRQKTLGVDAQFDYEGMHEQTRTFFPGAETNEMYFKMISDIAIRSGDPDLIRNLPDRWADGTPTFKNIPAWNERVLNAETRAQAVYDGRQTAEAKALKAQREKQNEEGLNFAYDQVRDGIDPGPTLDALRAAGVISGKDADQVTKAFRSSRDDYRKQGADFPRVVRMQAEMQLDPSSVTVGDITIAWAEGAFGPPQSPEAQAAHRQMLQDREESIQTQRRVLSDPVAASYVRQFEQITNPGKDVLGNVLSDENKLQADLLGNLKRDLINAGSPSEKKDIYNRHLKEYDETKKLYKANRNIAAPSDAVTFLLDDTLNDAQFREQITARGWSFTTFQSLRQQGSLTPEQYARVLQALDTP